MMREGVNYAILCKGTQKYASLLQAFARHLSVRGMRARMRESMRQHHCIL